MRLSVKQRRIDIKGAINKALNKCESEECYKDDVLLLSDGDLPVLSGLSRQVVNRR